LSRNRERLGGTQKQDTSPPPQAMDADTGGFSFVVPTDFVALPSEGKYYPEGHPLHGEDSIEIRQMTAKEEDILTSRTLLKKGVALDRVISNLIVNKRIDPDSLFVGDRNAIIVAMRVTGYGSDYETKVTCPSCGATTPYSFDLNEADVYLGEEREDFEITDNKDGTFEVVLPKLQMTITFKLLTGRDEKFLLSGIESDRKRKKDERNITRQLVNTIVAVNGNSDPEVITYLANHLPSLDSRHFRKAYRLVAPNVDLTQHYECSECDHEQDMEVPLSADFFWPDR